MAYDVEVLADSPELFWRMGSSPMADASGHGHVGDVGSGLDYTQPSLLSDDPADHSTNFFGTTGYVFCSANTGWIDTGMFDAAQPFTIEAVVAPSSISGTRMIAGEWYTGDSSRSRWALRVNAGSFEFKIRGALGDTPEDGASGGVVTLTNDVTPLEAGKTYHLVAVFEGGSNAAVRLYVDGVEQTPGVQTLFQTVNHFLVGIDGDLSSSPFNGIIDEIAYYSHALSAARVMAHYGEVATLNKMLVTLPPLDTTAEVEVVPANRMKAIAPTLMAGAEAKNPHNFQLAFLPRLEATFSPPPNKLRAVLPKLTADLEAEPVPAERMKSVLPPLTAHLTKGYPGRTPAGGTSWHNAVDVVRGLLTQPTPRQDYPMTDDSGLVQPYFSPWWKWTADTTDQVWFSTLRSIPERGRAIDTIISIYTENAGALETVVISDDLLNYRASQAVIDSPVIGTTYYIRAGAFDSEGSGIAYYVLDNDLCPPPTLRDLIVQGGGRGPAGAAAQGDAQEINSYSISAPTHIPAGEQAWWTWTAPYSGSISFDALLSQNWFTGGAGAEDPRVALELWDEDQFVAYSEEHGTVDYEPRGQITWNVTEGHAYHIKMSPMAGAPDINGFLRLSQLTAGAVIVPEPKTTVVDVTPQARGDVAAALGIEDQDSLKYFAEMGDNPVELPLQLLPEVTSQERGFAGSYTLNRSFLGVDPQLDHMGSLTCLWSHARTGARGNAWWGKNGTGYWYGADPPPPGAIGRGDCSSNWYTTSEPSDTMGIGVGVGYSADVNSVVFTYANASMSVSGTHFQISISQLVQQIRDTYGFGEGVALSGLSLMADEPTRYQDSWAWHAHVTRPDGNGDDPFFQPTFGPYASGRWYGSGPSDAEQWQWMDRELFEGASPRRNGGAEAWTAFPEDLLAEVHTYENDSANDQGFGVKGKGLTLAYLPREVKLFNPPYQVWDGFDRETASVSAISYGARVLMRVQMQEPAYLGGPDPLAGGFAPVVDYQADGPGDGSSWPPPHDPGPVGSQILFGPYPVKFSPSIDVLVFGPRHKSIDWPDIATTAQTDLELVTQVPSPNADPLARPVGSVRFEMPSFTLLDGIPVAARAADRIAFTSETVPPSMVDQLAATPHLVDLGENLRFPPILATSQTNTSSYRRQPKDPLQHRTTREVTSLPSSQGLVTLASPLPGPERVSSYAYWRGTPAASTAISFRPTFLGEESLIAAAGDWITGDEITVLMTVVLRDRDITSTLSPLFCAAKNDVPRAGLFFNASSELMLWDTTHDVEDVSKRIRGKLQLVDDIRRVSQPVLVGARINNVTRKVTLVAADSRLRTVETSLATAIPADHQLLIGDAGALTSPGAYDLLDMRWWTRPLSDPELLSAAAAMTDLWGVLA